MPVIQHDLLRLRPNHPGQPRRHPTTRDAKRRPHLEGPSSSDVLCPGRPPLRCGDRIHRPPEAKYPLYTPGLGGVNPARLRAGLYGMFAHWPAKAREGHLPKLVGRQAVVYDHSALGRYGVADHSRGPDSMSFADLLTPRKEVLSDDGIEGIVDLANLADSRRRKLETKPDVFFALTYPTADIRRIVDVLDQRYAQKGTTPGLFLFEGLKGVGKSHLLLFIYHLFKSPKEAKTWLARHGLTCRVPEGVTPVVNKFTDLPLLSVWDFIFEQVTGRRPSKSTIQPGLAEVEAALSGRQVVLIFDELEQGVRVLQDSAVRAQNIAFLQMLSEWGNRSNQVTLFASIYSDQEEPGATLKRVPACRVQFAQAQDRARVVLHRIFANYLDFRPESAGAVVDSYVNTWRRHAHFDADAHRRAMLDGYPFVPDLLEIMLRRVPARGGFQNVRGALGFLAHLVRLTHTGADLITPSHANILDREVAVRLSDLDPGSDLITRAQGNLVELTKTVPAAVEIASTTLLYTLTGVDSRTHGATRDELIRSVLRPGGDINDFEQGLRAFEKYAAYFHSQEGRYFFDREENADARVEFHSLKIDEGRARQLIKTLWRDELFREPAAVIWTGLEETRAGLEAAEKDRLRWVLAPRRLAPDDRQALYHGLGVRNQIVLLEPRDETLNLEGHPDLLKWARRLLAAQALADMTREATRRAEYDRIGREDRGHIVGQIRRSGLIYVKFEAGPAGPVVEEESLGPAVSKEDVLAVLNQRMYPPQLLAEHLMRRLEQVKSRVVREVDREYRSTLGFPVPTHAGSVTRALRLLCKDRKLGVYHHRGNFCGSDPQLSDGELLEATVGEPFEGGEPTAVPAPAPGPTVVAGPIPGRQGIPSAPPAGEQIARRTGPQSGIGRLRQTVAAILQEYPSATITRARFSVFVQQNTGDLSSLPAAFRGSFAGPGALTVEITLTKEGTLAKAEVEQLVERLPSVPQAEYSADLSLSLPPEEGSGQPHP
jgi:hypothetical protein